MQSARRQRTLESRYTKFEIVRAPVAAQLTKAFPPKNMQSPAAPVREPNVRVIFASSRIEPILAEELRRYASTARTTRSQIIRLALIEFLEKQAKK